MGGITNHKGEDQAYKSTERRITTGVRVALERHLRHEPGRVSKSRIRRLRGINHPQYRLRVGEIRVFYDIAENSVKVLAVVSKTEATSWLEEMGG